MKMLMAISMAVVLCFCASVANAEVIAEFTGGTGTGSADAFVGMAGGGWAGEWQTVEYDTTAIFTVDNTDPL